METETQLIETAADTAMHASADYLRAHNLKADVDALLACIRSWMKAKLPEALHDAKQAFDANMPKIAEATFLATMRQAGIEAAKEAGFPNRMRIQGGKRIMEKFRVILGKAGTMYAGSNYMQAMAAFSRAMKASKQAGSAYAGEGALLLHDGKIEREYVGNSGESTTRVEF